jgi:hypothetical protein
MTRAVFGEDVAARKGGDERRVYEARGGARQPLLDVLPLNIPRWCVPTY